MGKRWRLESLTPSSWGVCWCLRKGVTAGGGAGFCSLWEVSKVESHIVPVLQLPGESHARGRRAVTVHAGGTVTSPVASFVLCSMLTKLFLILIILLTAVKTVRLIFP